MYAVLFWIFFTINMGGMVLILLIFTGTLKRCLLAKQQSTKFIKWEKLNKINIKNRTYYIYNDQIDLKDFDARLLKVDKKLQSD